MKKIFLVLTAVLITISLYGQSTFKRGIKVGNSSTTATVDTISTDGTLLKIYQGATRLTEGDIIGDSIQNRIDDAYNLTDVGLLLTDTTDLVATKTDLLDFEGAGSGITMYKLQFMVDITFASVPG